MRHLMTCFSILILSSFSVLGQSNDSPVAIVELFTSQGCSSCPSADRLLKQVVDAKSDKGTVIGLSFHVSYWNRLGWKDPYSNEEYTNRQKWYARQMGLSTIYTPQMVVDGEAEFVGSNKEKLKANVLSAFKETKTSIKINNVTKRGKQLSFDFGLESNAGNQIHFAIVQKKASNFVPRGENQYKTLEHANVVRTFKTIPYKKTGRESLALPDTKDNEELILVAYSQNEATLKVHALGIASI